MSAINRVLELADKIKPMIMWADVLDLSVHIVTLQRIADAADTLERCVAILADEMTPSGNIDEGVHHLVNSGVGQDPLTSVEALRMKAKAILADEKFPGRISGMSKLEVEVGRTQALRLVWWARGVLVALDAVQAAQEDAQSR